MAAAADAGPTGVLVPGLSAALRQRADADGFVPFDRFMDVALYASGVGYYARDRSPFGPAGDFYTAPRVSPLYATTLAARTAEVLDALGRPAPCSIVDLGSGDGTLLAGVVRALGERGAAEGIEAVAIDWSPARRAASLEVLGPIARTANAVARGAGALAEAGPVRGVVLVHELLDAQPALRLRWDGSAWQELGYRWRDEGLVPAERPLETAVPGPALPELGPQEADRVLEVSPAAEALVRELADHLETGLGIVVDFGAEEHELLAAHARGTVAAVQGHRSLRSPATAPGASDLSTFVNFTRIRSVATAAGLAEISYRTQAEALGAWRFPQELARALDGCRSPEDEVRLRLAAKNLLFGFGTFRVLELAPPSSAERLRAASAASPPATS